MRTMSFAVPCSILALLLSMGADTRAQTPAFTQIEWRTNSVVLRGTNGMASGDYRVLVSSDVAVPAEAWSALATNVFGADGSFDCTNPIAPGQAAQFFRLNPIPPEPMPDFGLYGWATVNGNTIGGWGGTTQTVSTASAFITAAQSTATNIIYVQGTLNVGEVRPNSNKTIIGLGTNATLMGTLVIGSTSSYGLISNIIVRNVIINNASGAGSSDGITVQYGAHHLWVDHCTFLNNPDGQLDTTHASDYITYSWNKFYYTRDNLHNFVNLVGHDDDNEAEDTGTLRITWHHNWYGNMCRERMPRVRYGQNHVYNNYYGCPANGYCVGVGCDSQLLVENNYFDDVENPWKNYSSAGCLQGLIHWNVGNVFVSTTIPSWAPNSTVFTPPYAYPLDKGSSVKTNVMTWAGAGAIQP